MKFKVERARLGYTADGKTSYADRDLEIEADCAKIHTSPSKNGFVLSLEKKDPKGWNQLVAAFQPGEWKAVHPVAEAAQVSFRNIPRSEVD